MSDFISRLRSFLWSGEPISSPFANSVLLIVRVGLGAMMAFAHGLGKLPPPDGLIAGVGALGFPLPFAFAWITGLSEFFSALAISLGLATRFNALMISITMSVAAFGVHFSDPFRTKELALVYLCSFLFFAAVGAGRYSLDYIIREKIITK